MNLSLQHKLNKGLTLNKEDLLILKQTALQQESNRILAQRILKENRDIGEQNLEGMLEGLQNPHLLNGNNEGECSAWGEMATTVLTSLAQSGLTHLTVDAAMATQELYNAARMHDCEQFISIGTFCLL